MDRDHDTFDDAAKNAVLEGLAVVTSCKRNELASPRVRRGCVVLEVEMPTTKIEKFLNDFEVESDRESEIGNSTFVAPVFSRLDARAGGAFPSRDCFLLKI
jgi:hypothetical protein